MATVIEHNYQYRFPSRVNTSQGDALQFATSGGVSPFPYFFQGQLRRPRIVAQCLRVLSKVVAARFHIPPAMLKRILENSDPVVTSGGGLLRFEGFSACCSAYARVDLNPDAYEGVAVSQGTTNVDFNREFRAALTQIREGERVGFAVGTDELALLRGAEQIVERKVKLPVRWLKGFVEVQAYQSRMHRRATFNKIEALRFFRSIPRSVTAKAVYSIVTSGTGLRISQDASKEAIRVAGIERLRLLEELAPAADRLTIYADERGEASEWHLAFGPVTFAFALSAEVWRGFSGEGQVLSQLAGTQPNSLLELLKGALKWQAELRACEFCANWDASPDAVQQAFATLGSRGLVGYDLDRGAYFHRELPFDLQRVEEIHPRLQGARKIAESVRFLRRTKALSEAEVAGSGVTHRVCLTNAKFSCTCPWHAKHQGARGPCKHVLAVQLVLQDPS